MPALARYTDIFTLAGLLAATWLVLATPGLGNALIWLARKVLDALRSVSARAAWLLDYLLPVNPRNAVVSRAALSWWGVVNLTPIALWTVSIQFDLAPLLPALALTACGLGVFNMLFLTGAYWALKEGMDVMNGDKPRMQRQFGDLSTATNLTVVVAAFVFTLTEVALVQQWLQDSLAVPLIRVRDSVGAGYLDHLIAVLASVPGVSVVLALSGVADRVGIEPGLGSLWARSIATFGSILLFGTIFGFVQQHSALKWTLGRLLVQPEGTALAGLLRERLKRAPSIVKRDLREAYRKERDDRRRLRLLDLALDKQSYSAPAYFLRGYSASGPAVQSDGAALVAGFLVRRGHQLDGNAAREVIAAALAGFSARAFHGRQHLPRVGAIVLPCLERLTDTNHVDPASLQDGLSATRMKPVQAMLRALLQETDVGDIRDRVAQLLLRAKAQDSLPDVLRSAQHATDPAQVFLFNAAAEIVNDRSITFVCTDEHDPLSEMVRTLDWARHALALSESAREALATLRDALVLRQRTQ